jgi:hypothetical protein
MFYSLIGVMSVAQYKLFNRALLDFLTALRDRFPSHILFRAKALELSTFLRANDSASIFLNDFLKHVFIYKNEIYGNEYTAMTTVGPTIPFLSKIDFAQIWTPDLDDETKQAVFLHLQHLCSIAGPIHDVKPCSK